MSNKPSEAPDQLQLLVGRIMDMTGGPHAFGDHRLADDLRNLRLVEKTYGDETAALCFEHLGDLFSSHARLLRRKAAMKTAKTGRAS